MLPYGKMNGALAVTAVSCFLDIGHNYSIKEVPKHVFILPDVRDLVVSGCLKFLVSNIRTLARIRSAPETLWLSSWIYHFQPLLGLGC